MSESKKTVIVGATTNETRYAWFAAERLKANQHEIVPLGIKKGLTAGEEIINLRSKPIVTDVDTITLYVGTQNQSEWVDYIIALNPKRIIFNPGTENDFFVKKAEAKGIETVYGCTLVMLSAGTY